MTMSDLAAKVKKTAPPRKKACSHCTKAKVRCDLRRPSCLRCQFRSLTCHYSNPNDQSLAADIPNEINDSGVPGGTASLSPNIGGLVPRLNGKALGASIQTAADARLSPFNQDAHSDPSQQAEHQQATGDELDFSKIFLISKTDSTLIRDRWMGSFLPASDQRPKVLPPHTVQYLSCVLRTFSKQMLRPGTYPPIIHSTQMAGPVPLPLANCFSIIRMWESQAHGSEAVVAETVQREMKRLYDEVGGISENL